MSTVPHTLEPVHFSPQTVYCGDCEEVLSQFPTGCADLVYIDPPFNSNRNYEVFWGDVQEKRAFDDRYGDAQAYIAYMRPRVEQLHRVLKPTGSFYYHCDWHASHYIKVMLDEIFGFNFFQNEIVWQRTSARSDSHKYNHVHDTIFLYSKSNLYTYNVQYQEYSEDYINKFYKYTDPDSGRRFMADNLTAAGTREGRSGLPWHDIDVKAKGIHWKFTIDKLDELDRDGRIYWPAKGSVPRYKRYLDEMSGVSLQSIWTDIKAVQAHAKERLGYPTQKPLPLLERIINASSNPGDIVLDAFCGCGTTLVAARQLGRRFVGIDISPSSCNVMGQRLEQVCGMRQAPPSMGVDEIAGSWDKGFVGAALVRPGVAGKEKGRTSAAPTGRIADPGTVAYYRFSNLPRSAEELRKLPGFEFENWAVLQLGEVLKHHGRRIRAQVNRAKVGDFGLDGKIYLVNNASIKRGDGKGKLFNEAEDYVPIQVKNTDKVGRPEIDKFAHALRRDERSVGFFIGWEFSRDALVEISRVGKLEEAQVIIPVPVQQLIAETFDTELLALAGR